jgi:predicted DNA-binding transcriptional regulator AlpA
MNHSHKRPFLRNSGTRTPSNVRLEVTAFAVNKSGPQRAGHAPRLPDGSLGEETDAQGTRNPPDAISRILEKRTSDRRTTLDDAIDALQLLTVTDVCKLLRLSKPTLWRLRRSGNFPDPTTVTERIFAWRRFEIDAWGPLMKVATEVATDGHSSAHFSWSERRDLNSGPLAPHASALPDCATLRHDYSFGRLCSRGGVVAWALMIRRSRGAAALSAAGFSSGLRARLAPA